MNIKGMEVISKIMTRAILEEVGNLFHLHFFLENVFLCLHKQAIKHHDKQLLDAKPSSR